MASATFAVKTHKITLSNESIEIPNRNFYVSTIVDNRADKTNIGFAQSGAFNSKRTTVLTPNLKDALTNYFAASLPNNSNSV